MHHSEVVEFVHNLLCPSQATGEPVTVFVFDFTIDNREGGGIGNACTYINYGDVAADVRHGTPPS